MVGFDAGKMVSRTGRLRIYHLRADTGGEYISKELIKLCGNSGITMRYTAMARAPSEWGVRAGWTDAFDHI